MFRSILPAISARGHVLPLQPSIIESLEKRRLLSLVAFQPQFNVSDGATPIALAVADMNGDGKPDLVVQDSGGSVSVLLGNGNGTFAMKQSISDGISNSTGAIALADFNHDGNPDVAVSGGSSTISIFLGSSDGTLQPATSISAALPIHSIIAADVNGDGNMDLIASDVYGGITVFLGDGHGGFGSPIAKDLNPNGATRVVAAQFTNGGPMDLAVTNYSLGTVTILPGNNDGTFAVGGVYSGLAYASSLTTADFNGDGKPDLVIGTLNGAFILLGNGNGTFQAPRSLGIINNIDFLTSADMDGDGKPDLIMTVQNYQSGGLLAIAVSNGDGTFANPQVTALGNYPQAPVVADIDGDGRADLLVPVPDAYAAAEFLNATTTLSGIELNPDDVVMASGTAGADTISLSVADSELTVQVNADVRSFPLASVSAIDVFGVAGNDSISTGAGVPALFVNGGGGNDTIIAANQGRDTLQGGASPDSISGGKGAQVLDGGNGADTIIAGKGPETLTGDGGLDSLVGGKGPDSLDGGDGNDTLRAGTGANTLQGGDGNDSLVGGAGLDILFGGLANDTLVAGTGNNTLRGNGGPDSIDGSAGGNNYLSGGGNNDILIGDTSGGGGIDTLIGGVGTDTLVPGPHDVEPDGLG